MPLQPQLDSSVHAERHYAVTEIAEMWNLNAYNVRELFDRELGLLRIEAQTVQCLRPNPKNQMWSGRSYA